MLVLYGKGLLYISRPQSSRTTSPPSPQLPLSVRDCLCNIFAPTIPICRPPRPPPATCWQAMSWYKGLTEHSLPVSSLFPDRACYWVTHADQYSFLTSYADVIPSVTNLQCRYGRMHWKQENIKCDSVYFSTTVLRRMWTWRCTFTNS